jgi:hypothetical protein
MLRLAWSGVAGTPRRSHAIAGAKSQFIRASVHPILRPRLRDRLSLQIVRRVGASNASAAQRGPRHSRAADGLASRWARMLAHETPAGRLDHADRAVRMKLARLAVVRPMLPILQIGYEDRRAYQWSATECGNWCAVLGPRRGVRTATRGSRLAARVVTRTIARKLKWHACEWPHGCSTAHPIVRR